MNALRDPLVWDIVIVLWLSPCALQDWRTRRVSNWLTVPLFLSAWPLALLLGNLTLTFAVFLGVYVAWRLKAGMGAADGKIAVALAAIAPPALAISFVIEALVFLFWELRGTRNSSIPGALYFWVGAVVATAASALRVLQ